jgi:hypothetical protein
MITQQLSRNVSPNFPIPIPNAAGWKERLISRKLAKLCGRSPDYESIVFSRKPLFELRGGPIFFWLRRSLALDLGLFFFSLFSHQLFP